MKKIIVGNWKMNPQTYKEAEDLQRGIINNTEGLHNIEIVLCPPFTWLTDLSHKVNDGVTWGAQDLFWEDKGAYTGEISAAMLKSSNVEYVIIGHSERRKYFNETNDVINKKIKAALEAGLKVILCVGENEGEDRQIVLEKQLTVISNFKFLPAQAGQISNLLVAYEPVWAIGTGKNCEPESVLQAAGEIKKIAGDVRVIYGGSVNSQNAAKYLEIVDGLLVGGASLDAGEFVKIVKSVS